MTFDHFSTRARQIFDGIPPDYREGVDGLDVTRKTELHPSLPEVYTLGECLSEFYPSEFGGAGHVRSRVVLYYGSFLALSQTRDDWDWEEELFETITHEVRHHLEHLAQDESLEEMDYAEDQNFARREGERFDPFFFRYGNALGEGMYEVDGDVFLETEVTGAPAGRVEARWGERTLAVEPPDPLADVHYMRVANAPEGVPKGDLYVVLVRRRGVGEWLHGLLGRATIRTEETEVEAAGL